MTTSKDQRKKLCAQLRDIAKNKGMTQEAVASRAGIRETNLNRLLNGKYKPSVDMLIDIARAVGAEVEIADKGLSQEQKREILNKLRQLDK